MPDNNITGITNINAAIDTNKSIAEVLSSINLDEKGGIFLPYIQRDFVWNEERIYSLLDSLMRGYPMGTILIWETDTAVNYRRFAKDYDPDDIDYDFLVDDKNNKILRQYVLDGQQRLQSLYIAMHGTYNNENLFFDLLSDTQSGYVFEFRSPSETASEGWLNVKDFLSHNFNSLNILNIIKKLKRDNIFPEHCTEEQQYLMAENADRLYKTFKSDHNIPVQTLRNDIPLKDIAEIFVRTNSGGVVLDATDLVMATIASEWTGANQAFNELVNIIKEMGFKNPRTFILQSCFAILLGTAAMTQTALKDFASSERQNELRQNFPQISSAINDVLHFVEKLISDASIHNFKIPFYNPILILVAYRYYHGQNDWNKNQDIIKSFLLTAFLCKDFIKPTQKLMRELLVYVSNNKKNLAFDLKIITGIFNNNNRNFAVNPYDLLDTRLNAPIANLILYLIYKDQAGYNPDTMTIHDHIFPRARLKSLKNGRRQRYSQNQYDSIINCELLTASDNIAKGAALPKDYFNAINFSGEDKLKKFLKLHAIPEQFGENNIDLYDLSNYEKFLEARKIILAERIKHSLGDLVSVNASTLSSVIKKLLGRQ
ncbi:MAG: DUF262 domain-containing protein [Synergistaceae bacterium]|nr:DUF262 domain-containing protein [Synergistaceae bacterium]MBQ7570584.1 DUF262 domain-containing protein [Synergistaceae bacterium]MBQ9581344.1 DUF262 domain-containing protein [Synergistaceae bacterium]